MKDLQNFLIKESISNCVWVYWELTSCGLGKYPIMRAEKKLSDVLYTYSEHWTTSAYIFAVPTSDSIDTVGKRFIEAGTEVDDKKEWIFNTKEFIETLKKRYFDIQYVKLPTHKTHNELNKLINKEINI